MTMSDGRITDKATAPGAIDRITTRGTILQTRGRFIGHLSLHLLLSVLHKIDYKPSAIKEREK